MLSYRTGCETSLVNSWFRYWLARVGLVWTLMGNENCIQHKLLISFNSNLWGRSHNPSEYLFRKSVRLQTFRFFRLILLGNHNLVLTEQCRALSGQCYTAHRWNDSVPLGHRVSYSNGHPQLLCSVLYSERSDVLEWSLSIPLTFCGSRNWNILNSLQGYFISGCITGFSSFI